VPTGAALGTVVLLHGGYWLPQYGLDLLAPMARRFTRLGYATWNVEYRRTSEGGGWPHTFTDVALAMDRLAEEAAEAEEKVPGDVVVIGHSAGGHLAGWVASRTAQTPGGSPRVVPKGVVSLSGVLDLTTAASAPESSGPVVALMGGTPEQHPDRYQRGDPTLLVPAACPVFAAQATQEQVIPVGQAAAYVAKARASGGTATVVALEGDHFSISTPDAPSFATVQRLVERALAHR
jgi:acetyl esterase/lipase